METITFKYNGKQYTTNNLEKKLEKLGISKSDIELLGNKFKKIELEEDVDKEKVIVRSTKDNIRRICLVQKGTRPPFKKLFEKQRWNPITKTGIKEITDDYIRTMYYE
jgi:hypothetical protein